jgi:hypothetical protein
VRNCIPNPDSVWMLSHNMREPKPEFYEMYDKLVARLDKLLDDNPNDPDVEILSDQVIHLDSILFPL